jgi:hypothetical protein
MKADDPGGAMESSAARLSGVAFGALGTGLVLAGVISIATGLPHQAHNMAPLAGPGEIGRRLGEISPLLAAALAALVAAGVVLLLGARKLKPASAAVELIVLGAAIEVCVLGAIGRIGYAADGSVLLAGVACLMGGAAVVAAGLIAGLVSE